MAKLAGDEPARRQALDTKSLLEKGFDAAFIRGGKLHGTLEDGVKNDIDGALLPIINFGVVREPELIRERGRSDEAAQGALRAATAAFAAPTPIPRSSNIGTSRRSSCSSISSLPSCIAGWAGRAEADAMLQRIVGKAAIDHNIIPEMYVAVPCKLFPGKIGDPTGAMPMVGYGPGVYVLHILDREAAR